MLGTQPSSAADLLLGLRRHGNRYVQRVVTLARSADESVEVAPDVEASIEQERGGGQSLDHATRSKMGNAFGADFGGVRVHTDFHADALSREVNAISFTTGQDIFFRQGAYNPGTSAGKELLVHELTHVVQQGGPAIQPKLALGEPGDAHEQEADEVARLVTQHSSFGSPAHVQASCACGGTCETCSNARSDKMDRTEAASGAVHRQPAGQDSGQPAGGAPVAAPAPVPAGGCRSERKTPPPDPRFIDDNLCLLSQQLTGDKRLNDAFHNNPPLTVKDNGEPVRKMQQALLIVGEVLPRFGADGNWGGSGSETTKAVASFQSKNGIPPGGFEAGRKTLLALDAHLQQQPPVPPPPPGQTVTVTAQCGQNQQAGSVIVTGSGFPPGKVDLTVEDKRNSAVADGKGNFIGSVTADLDKGSHAVTARSGSVQGFAQFTTPCRAQPPTPVPGNEELETVLNLISIAYQLLLTRERDGLLALCRDLTPLDQPEASATAQVLISILIGLVSFLYGFGEGAIRQSIIKALNDRLKDHQERIKDLDEGTNQVVSAILQAGQGAIAKAGDRNIKTRSDLLAGFCDNQLDQVTREGFAALGTFETDFKPRLRQPAAAGGKQDPRNQSGDPRVDVAWKKLDAVNDTAANAFQVHYDAALRQWDSKLAQRQLGVDEESVKDTNLDPLKGDADIPTGVLKVEVFIPIVFGKVKPEQVFRARIDGLSERVRTQLQGRRGADLNLPIVADSSIAGSVVGVRVGITESHRVVHLTTDAGGAQWLTERGDGDLRQGELRVADTVLNARMPEIEKG